ncbi:MAG TPA: hypothetical protein VFW46_18265 [Stellaceae bacterium]|nr:hypothetical protein [Stellaceae bacterium]
MATTAEATGASPSSNTQQQPGDTTAVTRCYGFSATGVAPCTGASGEGAPPSTAEAVAPGSRAPILLSPLMLDRVRLAAGVSPQG